MSLLSATALSHEKNRHCPDGARPATPPCGDEAKYYINAPRHPSAAFEGKALGAPIPSVLAGQVAQSGMNQAPRAAWSLVIDPMPSQTGHKPCKGRLA